MRTMSTRSQHALKRIEPEDFEIWQWEEVFWLGQGSGQWTYEDTKRLARIMHAAMQGRTASGEHVATDNTKEV